MDRIKGLKEYVQLPEYKKTLGIPEAAEEMTYYPLAQGEYNINYWFVHPVTEKKLVLRVNTGSQMHLEHQIEYEYNALKILENCGRTPKPLYVDGSRKHLDYGVMVMEYLEGRPLDYRKDLEFAAQCLADIHSVQVPKVFIGVEPKTPGSEESGLLRPENPLQAILDECNEMVKTYYQSDLGESKKKKQIERLLNAGQKKVDAVGAYDGYCCCINTELNSGNFLINGEGRPNYLVDWEKPLMGDPVQDLGHFLAPTTTFWKTDVILSEEEMNRFAVQYKQTVGDRFDVTGIEERLNLFIPITCLRGITWCAMAWVQYQEPGRLIRNEETFRKMESYLNQDFLDMIEKRYY
jgi:thiamine kinase-like enzyme